MVEQALRNVMREALLFVSLHGLPGAHHFYLTFSTSYPGVQIPQYLRQRYPEEMTIVIQYQYQELKVTDDYFSVTLSFNNSLRRLTIPLAAVSTFADPSVNFALRFRQSLPLQTLPEVLPDSKSRGDSDESEDTTGKIITLDSFRKK
jgi:hypothetical protein